MTTGRIQALVKFLAQSLVVHPEQVEVSIQEERDKIVVKLQVGQEDTGRIIGKSGRVANAIRSLLRVAAARQTKPVILKIR